MAVRCEPPFDHLSGTHAKQGWFRLTAGVRLADPEPVLGLNWRGKVVPFVPRAQPLFTYVNPAGKTECAFKKLGFAHNPIVPHTVVRGARTCESCHANPRALGLGLYTSQEHPKLEEFGQPRDFRWDRIVDEDGLSFAKTASDSVNDVEAVVMVQGAAEAFGAAGPRQGGRHPRAIAPRGERWSSGGDGERPDGERVPSVASWWGWTGVGEARSGRPPDVAMMQATDFGNLDDHAEARPLD